MKGKLIVIVAPSGTGKSTLIKKLKLQYPEITESVSYTTRKQRPGEVHGVSYFFIEKDEFLDKRDKSEFLEWAEVHGNFYGTSKKFVETCLDEGKSILFDLDVKGSDSFRAYFGDLAQIIFIAPPSVEELEKRLKNRGTESEDVINLRLSNARKELLRKNDFNYLIVNDEFEGAYQRLSDLIGKILKG